MQNGTSELAARDSFLPLAFRVCGLEIQVAGLGCILSRAGHAKLLIGAQVVSVPRYAMLAIGPA